MYRILRSVTRGRLPTHIRYSHVAAGGSEKVTIPALFAKKQNNEPIAVLTAHDSISAKFAELAGVDVVLVGDSLAMVAMGFESTTQITLDDMIYHTRAVARGAKNPFIVSDLPFGSYERGPDQALDSTIRMIKEGNAECVKFEGGRELVPTVAKLSSYGLPTMPHIGLTPQRQVQTGGFKVQAKTATAALSVLEDAVAFQEAGASMLLLEGVPARVGAEISKRIDIPIIGIGAGPHTHGQVLVQMDMMGGFDAFTPKFVKKYAELRQYSVNAIQQYVQDVRTRQFPSKEHIYTIKSDELAQFIVIAEKQFPVAK